MMRLPVCSLEAAGSRVWRGARLTSKKPRASSRRRVAEVMRARARNGVPHALRHQHVHVPAAATSRGTINQERAFHAKK